MLQNKGFCTAMRAKAQLALSRIYGYEWAQRLWKILVQQSLIMRLL